MAKKDFRGGFDSLLQSVAQEPKTRETPPQTAGNVARAEDSEPSTIQKKKRSPRATFVMNDGQLHQLRLLSYWSRLSQKEILSNALAEYIDRYEAENGPLKEI